MKKQGELIQVGLSDPSMPLDKREEAGFTSQEVSVLLHSASTSLKEAELVALATCKRTEFYLATQNGKDPLPQFMELLQKIKPLSDSRLSEAIKGKRCGIQATRHLFRVATGLDSAILGEIQIVRQIREAMQAASSAGTLGPWLNHLFIQAIALGKSARQKTDISLGSASIGSALAGILQKRSTQTPKGRLHILVIGAGEVAEDLSHHVSKRGFANLYFINRNSEKASRLAREYQGIYFDWSVLEEAVCRADAVVAATSSHEPVVSRKWLDKACRMHRDIPILVIDAGMPRNVEAGSHAEVMNIDSIREEQQCFIQKRHLAVPHVERMIRAEVKKWARWKNARRIEKAISRLYTNLSMQIHKTVQDISTHPSLPTEEMEKIICHSFRQLLHPHVKALREISGH